MKKIAVITSGLLPMPAVKDGAIEMLLQYTIDYNEIHHNCEMLVFSIDNEEAKNKSKNYKNTTFSYIKINKFANFLYQNICRVIRKLFKKDLNFQYLFMKKTIEEVKKNKFDFILIESDNHFAYHFLKHFDIPVILYLHNDKLNKDVKNGNYIINNCFKIFTVSEFIKTRVLTLGDKYESKVEVILNGMDFSKFELDKYEKWNFEYRKKYNIDFKAFVFLYVGRIEPNKGTLELIKAFNKLQNNSIKLCIVGGSFHSSNKKSNYFKLVLEESSKNNNIFFTGYIPHDDIAKYYAMSNALVVPSIWEEPAGLVNLEAIISNCILVVSNVGGIKEYIDKNTILVEKNEDYISNLSRALEDAIDKKNNIDKDYDIEYFSKEKYCERFFKTIDRVGEK